MLSFSLISAVFGNAVLFGVLFSWIRARRKTPFVLFDSQDLAKYPDGRSHNLPASAVGGTFQPLLQHYLSATQILVAISAASITFGGNSNSPPCVHVAKMVLASSVMWGVLFCWFMLYRYDEYSQNVESYTRSWFAATESSLFACVICFAVGYLLWAGATF